MHLWAESHHTHFTEAPQNALVSWITPYPFYRGTSKCTCNLTYGRGKELHHHCYFQFQSHLGNDPDLRLRVTSAWLFIHDQFRVESQVVILLHTEVEQHAFIHLSASINTGGATCIHSPFSQHQHRWSNMHSFTFQPASTQVEQHAFTAQPASTQVEQHAFIHLSASINTGGATCIHSPFSQHQHR